MENPLHPTQLCPDAISYAYQLGRLDLVSVLLTCIAITLVIGGWIAYVNIKNTAVQSAKEAASEIAEKATNEYLQEKLPEIIESYKFVIMNEMKNDVVNNIASQQEGDVHASANK